MALDENELTDNGKAILDASRNSVVAAWGKGIVGAAIGAAAGWYFVGWLMSQGFYGLATLGACIGVGFSMLSGRRMVAGGIFCAIVAFVLSITCEWYHSPFTKDPSFSYFVNHLHQLDSQLTYLMFALSSFFGFWCGQGK